MPTYDYECEKCGEKFEYFQNINDPLLKSCPKCTGPVKRLITVGAGIILKGKGFYQNDYRSSKSKCEEVKKDGTKAPCENAKSCPYRE